MNGFTEPLPGLLDDPLFPIPNLPSLPDVHIAPLRNPAPLRHGTAPLPLEPLTKSSEDHRHETRNTTQHEEEPETISPPRLKPSDVLLAREAKKPHLAISELLETSNDVDTQHLQLPSFVSLANVEKSPIQEHSHIGPHKRLRLDLDSEISARDVGRRLPRPPQKDDKRPRPVPLLPAMVTGLHEPPPSAGILPSMELDAPAEPPRSSQASKMQVKDMLTEAKTSTHVPPEAMLNTPDLPTASLAKVNTEELQRSESTDITQAHEHTDRTPRKDQKARRTRRKWSDEETTDLVAGVKKHGFGKWKQILTDKAFTFQDRTSIDLKDRYRVFVKDQSETHVEPSHSQSASQHCSMPKASEATGKSNNAALEKTSDTQEPSKGKRKRRPWTPAEDAALMQGLSKHGFQWTAIHDDKELDLSHRRATDLRDRIRNLYPEGYKHAEARPLKSEVRKSERAALEQAVSTNDSISSKISNSVKPILSARQGPIAATSNTSERKLRKDRAQVNQANSDIPPAVEHAGVTLPSLALDNGSVLDWGENITLPPLLDWDEIGM